jgi:excisionase family DNA binding protein
MTTITEVFDGAHAREFRAPKAARARIAKVERLVGVAAGHADVTLTRDGETATLDPVLVDALSLISRALETGEPVTVMVGTNDAAELSSQETADLLGVSRPHVVKLARTGELPHRMVGNRHRFRRADVLAYDQHVTIRQQVRVRPAPHAAER